MGSLVRRREVAGRRVHRRVGVLQLVELRLLALSLLYAITSGMSIRTVHSASLSAASDVPTVDWVAAISVASPLMFCTCRTAKAPSALAATANTATSPRILTRIEARESRVETDMRGLLT